MTSAALLQVALSPVLLEVVGMKNVLPTLERLAESLAKLQKALGEYLETQRSGFSRFYFVGDEDLLEMIGNGREPAQVRSSLPLSQCLFVPLPARALRLNAHIGLLGPLLSHCASASPR